MKPEALIETPSLAVNVDAEFPIVSGQNTGIDPPGCR